MKKTILLFSLVFSFQMLSAQERLSFEKVITFNSVKKNIIYSGINEWISTTFVSTKSIFEIDDKESGMIVISPNVTYSYGNVKLKF